MAICPNCRAQMPDGIQFCSACGAPMVPVRRSAQQQTAQQQPVQQQPAQQQPVQQQPYQQQPYQQGQPAYNYRQAPQQGYGAPPKAPGAFAAKVKGLWQQVTSQPNGQVDFNLLRIISLVFAIAFIIFSLGLCSRIYYNRNIGEVIDENDLSSKEARTLKDLTYATFRMDVKGVLKASGLMSAKDLKDLSKEDLEDARERLQESLNDSFAEYGFRYTMFQFGTLWGSLFLWVGLVAMLGAAGFWWLKGGRPYNVKQAVMLPALIAAGAVFLILFIMNLAVATCNEF